MPFTVLQCVNKDIIIIDNKELSSDKPNGHWFEANLLHCNM